MSGAESFHRHDWVWVEAETHLPDWVDVRRHHAAGRPFIVGRPPEPPGEGSLWLGLALPDKRRLGFRVERAAVCRHQVPLALRDVLGAAPQAWLRRLTSLASQFEAIGMEARVYGSLAWQAMAGIAYLREDSDLDLLLAPATETHLRRALRLLASMEDGPPRLDGEILLPDGSAVAWREAASDAAILLVKTLAGVALVPRATWVSALHEVAHA